jgi:hypothetical protein
MDFIETVTLTGQRQYILAAIHHASRKIRILGTTAHPTHSWVTLTVRNLLTLRPKYFAHWTWTAPAGSRTRTTRAV